VAWLILHLSGAATPAAATGRQADEAWLEPVNLSRSGSATNPRMAIDDQGIMHVTWQDTFAGLVYTRSNGEDWDRPRRVALPFLARDYQLASDSRGNIHAFWIDESGRALHSLSEANLFARADSWASPVVVAVAALSLVVKADANGDLHLAYIDALGTEESPAGIYYRRTSGSPTRWLAPVSLYQSDYVRGLSRNLASLAISLSQLDDETGVYVAWDVRPRKHVWLAMSRDGGRTWDDPAIVDRPGPENDYQTPFNLQVGTRGEHVTLIWQVGEPGTNCSQRTQSSSDAGATWTQTAPMFGPAFSCASENRLLAAEDGPVYLISAFSEGVFLSAWDGQRWSQPQYEAILQSFEDPEVRSPVLLDCRQAVISSDLRLSVIGCAQDSSGDIWAMSRSVAGSEAWFAPPLPWRTPVTIMASTAEMVSPILIADAEEQLHAFWLQPATGGTSRRAIFYVRGDGEWWSAPSRILSLAEEAIGSFTVALDPHGRLLVAWNGQDSGELYYSWAGTADALDSADWILPQALPLPPAAGYAPALHTDGNESVRLAYVVPINEQRGVFFTETPDRGSSWLPPARIFDAAAAGWTALGEPRLAGGNGGSLHALFQRVASPWGSGSLGLFYSRSADGGRIWSEATNVAEGAVQWSQLLTDGHRTVHRIWQTVDGGGPGLYWHDVSSDGGLNWSPAQVVPVQSITSGLPAAALDAAGGLHLIVAGEDTYADPILYHTRWDEQGWHIAPALSLHGKAGATIKGVWAAVSDAGQLGVILSLSSIDLASRRWVDELVYTGQLLDVTDPIAFEQSTPVAVPQATPAAPTSGESVTTLTATPDVSQLGGEAGEALDRASIISLGAGLAAALVAAVLGVYHFRKRGGL
jgi:hypothetical protein